MQLQCGRGELFSGGSGAHEVCLNINIDIYETNIYYISANS